MPYDDDSDAAGDAALNKQDDLYGQDIIDALPKPDNKEQQIALLQIRATVLLAQEVRALNHSYSYFHA